VKKLATVIMAAGKGKRMKSDLPKVLHQLNNRPMLHYVIDLAREIGSEKIITIIGHKRKLVMDSCKDLNIEFAVQKEQLGTGHAVQMTEEKLAEFEGDVLILSGDVPLLSSDTINKLVKMHRDSGVVASLLTSELNDPAGYGRIIRDDEGFVYTIVEHKDATPEQLQVNEINVGIYIIDSIKLFKALKLVDNNNAQGEYYLPDVIPLFISNGKKVNAVKTNNFDETRGINNIDQLTEAETILNARR